MYIIANWDFECRQTSYIFAYILKFNQLMKAKCLQSNKYQIKNLLYLLLKKVSQKISIHLVKENNLWETDTSSRNDDNRLQGSFSYYT